MAPQKIGSRPTGGGTEESASAPAKGGKSKMMAMIGGAVVLVLAGAAYWFLAGPGAAKPAEGEEAAAAEPTTAPSFALGEIVVVDSISINLEGGHYLRLGLGLQLATVEGEAAGGAHGGGGEFSNAKALDAAIALYAGHTVEELSDADTREELKDELTEQLKEIYHYEVVDVYYTDFVTQ